FSVGRYLALLPFLSGARIFTFTSQMLFIGNNLRLDGIPLRSSRCFLKGAILHYFLSGVERCLLRYGYLFITKFSVGRCLALLPFRSWGLRHASCAADYFQRPLG